ncbi:MAG: response regulator [Deltaproteobacteria bacterium]|nr:response regulator [Deltaproteobacteria bacterium]
MTATRRPTILVVDDEEDVVTFLTTLLADNGYATITARDGAEALARVRADHPDLVTLDITMPSQSGVRTYRELKADPVLARIPVIIVTGIDKEFEQFISTRHQVPPPEGYISKPIDKDRLLALVQTLLSTTGP